MTQTKETEKTCFDFLSLFLAVLIVLVAVVSVNCYITQYEMNYETSELESALQKVQDENARLQIEYQTRSSYLTVEKYAEEKLSLQKVSKYQYEYIDRDTVNTVSVEGEDEAESGFAEDIVKAFSVILEYFR